MLHEIVAKYIKEEDFCENRRNFILIKGTVCQVSVYRNQVDLMVHASRGDERYSKNAYIPVTYYNYEERDFQVGQFLHISGVLIKRTFQNKKGKKMKTLEVKAEYVY